MSQIHDGVAGGSFVEDGTAGSYIMDVVAVDVPIVQPISDTKLLQQEGPPLAEFIGHGQGAAILPGSIVWGMGVVYFNPLGMAKRINFTLTRSPSTRLDNDIFPNHVISMPVFIFNPLGTTAIRFNFVRQWNGLGGIFYLPSFPQLERKETAWPHAT